MSAGRMEFVLFRYTAAGYGRREGQKKGGTKTLGDNLTLASDGNDFVTFQHWCYSARS